VGSLLPYKVMTCFVFLINKKNTSWPICVCSWSSGSQFCTWTGRRTWRGSGWACLL
jgi:hypothetical protein